VKGLNISDRIKKITYGKNTGLSYSALWYGFLAAGFLWLLLVGGGILGILAMTEGNIYQMADLLKLITWSIYFLGGFMVAYKAGYKGWQHGLWVGLFMGLFSVIFLLELVPAVLAWEVVLFQWGAAAILGTSGGIVGLRVMRAKKDRRGYTFKEAKKEKFFKLDRDR
jgi:hypothetical protein